jgi:uncharacterized protein
MSWDYRAPALLPGGHLQTIWAAKCAAYWPHSDGVAPTWERQRWTTPDNDFIDVDHLGKTMAAIHKPLLVLFHGLEGGRSSHYVQAIAKQCELMGWRMLLAHFRGCSGEMNAAPRAYHSGDYEEIDWILRRACAIAPQSPTVALGISLGGNALMCWASKAENTASNIVSAVASVCSPLDLVSSGLHIGKGFNKLVYTRMFLGTMKPKAVAKWAQFPGLFNLEATLEARTLYEFDDHFTAPIHGFNSVMDYWSKASAKPQMHTIRIPALALNALNDPFIPTDSLPKRQDVSNSVVLWQPNTGGHVGFVGFQPWWALPGHVSTMPSAVIGWMSAQLSS